MFPLVAITSTWAKVGGVAGGTVIVRVALADVDVELRVTLNGVTVASTDENVVLVRMIVPENPSREERVRVEFAVWPTWRLKK